MIKKKIKILTLLIMVFFIISCTYSHCAPNNTSQSNNSSNKTSNNTLNNTSKKADNNSVDSKNIIQDSSDNEDVVNNDLFLLDDTVVLDKKVQGNVYIIASKKAIIKAPVYGNIYVSAQDIEFRNSTDNKPVYIRDSAYLLGNNINLSLYCQDLYVSSSSTLNIDYDSCILRDLRVFSPNVNLYGIVRRNAYINSSSISLKHSDNQTGLVQGNLTYYNDKQISLPDNLVLGQISYHLKSVDNTPRWVTNLSLYLSTFVVSVLFLLLLTRINPSIGKPYKKFNFKNFIKICIYGILTLLLTPLVCLLFIYLFPNLMLFTLPILLIYIALIFIGYFATMIYILEILKQKFKFKSKLLSIGVLFLINTVTYLISLLPILSVILTILMIIPGFGLLSKKLLSKK